MKILIATVLFSFIFSCAGISNRYSAKQYDSNGKLTKNKETDLGLVVSADEDAKFSSLYFGLINLTFENYSEDWIRIKNVTIDFGSDEKNQMIKIVSGNDIVSWQEAIKKTVEIQEFNQSLVLGTIAVLGTAVAATGGKSEIKAAGAIAGLGALAALTVDEYNRNLSKIEKIKIFPKTHLMAEEFSIPPGLFTKKWILLNTSKHKQIQKITFFNMTYKTDKDVTESVKVIFREKQTQSKWQGDIH